MKKGDPFSDLNKGDRSSKKGDLPFRPLENQLSSVLLLRPTPPSYSSVRSAKITRPYLGIPRGDSPVVLMRKVGRTE